MTKELLNYYDDTLRRLGVAARDTVHRYGYLHQVVHCWVVSFAASDLLLYFQQRSFQKADFPGLYDLTVTGHVDAEEDYLKAVLRETKEEIGLALSEKRLIYLGKTREDFFLPPDFSDREIVRVFLYEDPAPRFRPGKEVARIVKVPFASYCRKELAGETSLTAYTLENKPAVIETGQWCHHEKEFSELVYPYLKKVRASQ